MRNGLSENRLLVFSALICSLLFLGYPVQDCTDARESSIGRSSPLFSAISSPLFRRYFKPNDFCTCDKTSAFRPAIHYARFFSIQRRIVELGLPHPVIAGGEPMMQQAALWPLAAALKGRGFRCEVETNGTLAPMPEMVEAVSQWNVSPKLDNSGNPRGRRESPEALSAFREIDSAFFKFVVAKLTDLDEVSALADRHSLPSERVVLMPEGTTAEVVSERGAWLAEACVERGFRFSTRLHILLWGDERGR